MDEREVPQSVRDVEYAEARAEDFYGISEWAQPIFLASIALYLAFLRQTPELDTAAIYGVDALLAKFLHGRFRQVYENRRERKIREQPEPQPNPQAELIAGTRI